MRFQSPSRRNAVGIFLAALFIFVYPLLAHTASQAQGPDVPTEAEQAMFTKGQTLYTQGLYSEAIVMFSESLLSYPQSIIKDLNLLWLGRSYLRQGDIANAEKIGRRLREIPDTSFVDIYDEELRIARQNYVKSGARSAGRRNASATNLSLRELTPAEKSKGSQSLAPTTSVPPGQRVDQDHTSRTSLGQSATSRPAPQKVLVQSQKERSFVPPATAPARAVAPLVRLRIEEVPRVAAVNGALFYRLVISNEGNGAANDLIVREELDRFLDFASSDPAPSRQEIVAHAQLLTFRLPALQAGETRVIRIAVRPRGNAPANLVTGTKHSIIFRDSKGSVYHSP